MSVSKNGGNKLLDTIQIAIDDSIKRAIGKSFDEAIEKAVKDASDRRDEVISSTALKILSYYSVQDMGNHLEITIKKENK